MSVDDNKIGFRKDREEKERLRKEQEEKDRIRKEQERLEREKTTQGSVTIEPENKEKQDRSRPDKIFKSPKKKGYSGEYPKSLRVSLETHTAIATIATMQDINKYEAVTMIVEEYISNLSPTQQKLIKNSIKQVLEIQKLGGKV
ncbi:hypothetical protein [Bacillus sp. FSL R9-9410]|uniref:hypothetical protein n=1 Tax=Bacillus sp. FSL R9-9410 TaxID=2921590 RepID=UPI003100B473